MFVMHEPMNTSSIFCSPISESVFASSGSLGQHKIGSVTVARSMSYTLWYSAPGSASINTGFSSHASMEAMRRLIVRASPYPSEIIHFNITIFDVKYSATGSLSSLIEHPAAERSAEASESSKACSHLRLLKPSISRTRPANMFFLFFFGTVRSPALIAAYGMAFTRSRSVMPYCISPEKRTSTDSGMSSGITPVAAAKATAPEPAGNEMPMGKRVCESPPVPTVSGRSMRFNQEWMMPSPGRSDTPPRSRMKSGRVWWVTTSTGFGYAAVWQKDCITRSAEKPRQARSLSSSRVIGPVVSWLPTVVILGSRYMPGSTPGRPQAFATIFCASVYPLAWGTSPAVERNSVEGGRPRASRAHVVICLPMIRGTRPPAWTPSKSTWLFSVNVLSTVSVPCALITPS
mmetsp:Transcript_63781/g.195034  ORF Transcript_63781/g.195034 Transcript_63781/m.195034 type:complete len:403 (+) Transcript_63781:508-1716(+)